jgi:hypothetical protein
MLTVNECRKLAKAYRDKAEATGVSQKEATVLKNIAKSFSGLASQFEILVAISKERRR